MTACAVLALASAGCAGDGGEHRVAGAPTAPSVELPVAVETISVVPVTSTTSADVYAPTEGAGSPVVVLFHGLAPEMSAPSTMREDLSPLAEAVAEQGPVVVNAS